MWDPPPWDMVGPLLHCASQSLELGGWAEALGAVPIADDFCTWLGDSVLGEMPVLWGSGKAGPQGKETDGHSTFELWGSSCQVWGQSCLPNAAVPEVLPLPCQHSPQNPQPVLGPSTSTRAWIPS